jgi:transposase
MGLIEEFEQAQARQKGPGYSNWYERAKPDLSAEQIEALDEALRHPKFTAKAIVEVLKNWGIEVTPENVSRLRRKLANG